VYFLHNINNWNAFRETVIFLQTEALGRLGLTEQEEGYYFSSANAETLHHLLNDTPEQFLVFFQNLTYRQSNLKSGQNQELAKKVKKLRRRSEKDASHMDGLTSQVSHQSTVIQEHAQRIMEQCEHINALTEELDHTQKELHAVSSSTSYRLGRALTAVPRRIRHLLKGN
jgi:uncharacterized coiled-coil protein SlyX